MTKDIKTLAMRAEEAKLTQQGIRQEMVALLKEQMEVLAGVADTIKQSEGMSGLGQQMSSLMNKLSDEMNSIMKHTTKGV